MVLMLLVFTVVGDGAPRYENHRRNHIYLNATRRFFDLSITSIPSWQVFRGGPLLFSFAPSIRARAVVSDFRSAACPTMTYIRMCVTFALFRADPFCFEVGKRLGKKGDICLG